MNSFELAFELKGNISCLCKPVALTLCKWDKLFYLTGSTDDLDLIVEEHGSLGFAVSFCNAVQRFYDAIGYVPPGGDQSKRPL